MNNSEPEKVLIYTGPSLDAATIAEQLPDMEPIVKGPVRHGDFTTDMMEYEPAYVLIIEGLFHQNLSVWHKEIVWALQIPGVKGIYGAASMGALRAADLSAYGMIGCGKIFNWFNEGVLFSEAEVACVYAESKAWAVPLVNVRAALLKAIETEQINEEEAEYFFKKARAIHWTRRTIKSVDPILQELLILHDQKAIDALELLCTFRSLERAPDAQLLDQQVLSHLFSAQFERDRAVHVAHRQIKLQDLDSYIMLHDQEYETHGTNADHRILALMLADIYRIPVTMPELDEEWRRFNLLMNLRNQAEHDQWCRTNHVNPRELIRLLSDEVRLRKLRRALMVQSGPRRRTQRLLDYLKMSRQYTYWVNAAVAHEAAIEAKGGEEMLDFGGETNVALLLAQHAKKTGLTITGSVSDYVRENGFGSIRELMVVLSRDRLADNAELRRE